MDIKNKVASFLANIALELTRSEEEKKAIAEKEEQFQQIRKVIESMGFNVVILNRDDYYKLTGLKDPLKKGNAHGGKKTKVSDLPENSISRKMMEEAGFENFYLDDFAPYYDDETFPEGLMPPIINPIRPSKLPPTGVIQRSVPVPSSNVAFDMEDMGDYSFLDAAYNFAVVYMCGGKRNNVLTSCSVDSEGKMYIHDQKLFTVKTYTDVIDNCDKYGKKYDLDCIVIITNDVTKKIVPFIKKGLNDDTIKIIETKESIDYEGDLNEFLPYMGTGEVLVGLGPWLNTLQIEMSNHFMRHPQQRDNFPANFTRLKAFINSVKYWQDNRDNDVFIRDLGITDGEEEV